MLMNSKTGVAFSVAAIAAVIVLFASGPIVATQQAFAGFGFGGFNGGFGFHRGFGFHHFGFHHFGFHHFGFPFGFHRFHHFGFGLHHFGFHHFGGF
jgi:hypothetical protein